MSASRVLKNIENSVIRGFGNGHSGIDLAWDNDPNEPVIAHSPGQIDFLQTGYVNDPGSSGNASYGNCIRIKHPNGYATLYAHLETVYVTLGQAVAKGEVIGQMGDTGNSYGNHLHFEVHLPDGTKIDPFPYISADLPNLPTEDDEMLSYEQFLAYMARYDDEKAQKPESDWSKKEGYWQTAKEEKITDGSRPRSSMSREESIAILGRLGLLKNPNPQ